MRPPSPSTHETACSRDPWADGRSAAEGDRQGSGPLDPDLAGWRRERFPEGAFDDDAPAFLSVAPDWVCEVLPESTESIDRGRKMRIYRREGVGHVWLLDPRSSTLEVWRLDDRQWREVDTWEGDLRVRAEPFEAVEIDLARLWAR